VSTKVRPNAGQKIETEEDMRVMVAKKHVAAAIAFFGFAGTALAQTPTEVSIGLASRSFVSSGPRIADEMGLFARHGIKPKFSVIDGANGTLTALISKSIDVAMSGTPDAIAAQSRGQKVVVIANTCAGLSGTLVLSKAVVDRLPAAPSSPPSERLRALDGLTIASTSPTSSFTVSYNGAAKAAGANVRFTYMALPAMVAALASGAIQGYIGTAPFWVQSMQKDGAVIWLSGPKGELPAEFTPASCANLQVTREYADAHPDTVRAIAAAEADYADAVEHDPAGLRAAISRLYPDLDAKTVELMLSVEAGAWKTRKLTEADMAHEIAYVKMGGANLPGIDHVKPGDLLFP
jgi:ABC-type nitrate/sulfonate/bicarbonate transport system substrate-binding protein